MGAGDPALVVVFQLDLRHVQFQRAAFEPAFAQDHRQVAHAEQQTDFRRPSLLAVPRCAFEDRPNTCS